MSGIVKVFFRKQRQAAHKTIVDIKGFNLFHNITHNNKVMENIKILKTVILERGKNSNSKIQSYLYKR